MSVTPTRHALIGALRTIELSMNARSTPFGDEPDGHRGVVHWDVTGYVTVGADELSMWQSKSLALQEIAPAEDEFATVWVFWMKGMTVSTMQADILDVLDARDADSAQLIRLFGADREYREEVIDLIDAAEGSSTFVEIDRVQIPAGWRGLGVGRLLIDRALELVSQDGTAVIALQSHPYLEAPDPSQDALDRTDHVWESLGFVRIHGDVFARDSTLVHPYADGKERELGL